MYFPISYIGHTYFKYLPYEVYDMIWKIVELEEIKDKYLEKEEYIKNKLIIDYVLLTRDFFPLNKTFWEKSKPCIICEHICDVTVIIGCRYCKMGFCRKECFNNKPMNTIINKK